jgi:hypothetical protein
MFECHANAFFIRPGRVLGRKLQHFTPAHLFLLEAIKSPFVCGGPWELNDLIYGVLICSHDGKKARRFLDSPAYTNAFCYVWGILCGWKRANIFAEGLAFIKYVNTYMQAPSMLRRENEISKGSAFPYSIAIVWTLMERMPEEKAWALPMPLALAYVGKNAEQNGTEFMTETLKEMPMMTAQGA